MLKLPITNDASQQFITQLGNTKYAFYIKYNDVSDVWTMDLSDPVTNELILAGIALTTGLNLMDSYNLSLHNLAMFDTGLEGASGQPTVDDFGSRLQLIGWGDDEFI